MIKIITNLLVLLTLFITLSPLTAKAQLVVNSELEPYLKEFIIEGVNRNIDVTDKLMDRVSIIMLDKTLMFPNTSYFNKKKKRIHIAGFTMIDSTLVRQALFRKLFFLLIDDIEDDNSILKRTETSTFHYYKYQDCWDEHLDEYFLKIK